MSSILFNGCSFVWGDELKDPMNTRFSKLLSDQLGMDEVNLSLRGGSADRMFRTTLDYIHTNPKPEIIIMVWTGIDRFEYINIAEKDQHDDYYLQCSPSRVNQQEYRRLKPHLIGYMLKILDDYKRSIDVINKMCHIQFLCEALGIKLLQFQFTNRHRDIMQVLLDSDSANEREDRLKEYYKSKIQYLKPYSTYGLLDHNDLLGMSLDIGDVEVRNGFYGHPLEKSQVMFKDFMIQELRKHHDIGVQ